MTYMQHRPQQSNSHSCFKITSGGFHMWLRPQILPPSLQWGRRNPSINFFSPFAPVALKWVNISFCVCVCPWSEEWHFGRKTDINKTTVTKHVQGSRNERSGLTLSLVFHQKSLEVMLSSWWEEKKKNKKWFDYDESEKGKHLFMSLIQWQDRAGHLSPTDGNHL